MSLVPHVEVEASFVTPAPKALIYIRRSDSPLHWDMIPANDGWIQIRFLAKMQELKSVQSSLSECK